MPLYVVECGHIAAGVVTGVRNAVYPRMPNKADFSVGLVPTNDAVPFDWCLFLR